MQRISKLSKLLIDSYSSEEFIHRLTRYQINDSLTLSFVLKQLILRYHQFDSKDFIKIVTMIFQYAIQQLSRFGVDPNFVDFNDPQSKSLLMLAVQKTEQKIVQIFIETQHLNPFLKDSQGRTVIFYCLMNQNLDQGVRLLSLFLKNIPQLKDSTDKNNRNLVFEAIQRENVRAIQICIQNGIDMNGQLKQNGNTALYEAVNKYSVERSQNIKKIVNILLSKGAKHDVTKKEGNRPFNGEQHDGKHALEEEYKLNKCIFISTDMSLEVSASQQGSCALDTVSEAANWQFQSVNQVLGSGKHNIGCIDINCKQCVKDSNNKQNQGLQQKHENKQKMTNNHQNIKFNHSQCIQIKIPQQPQQSEDFKQKKQSDQLIPFCQTQNNNNNVAQINQSTNFQEIGGPTLQQRICMLQLQDSDLSDQNSSDQQSGIVENAYVITQNIDFKKVQLQIAQLAFQCQTNIKKAWKQITPFVSVLEQIAYQHRMRVDLIGSLATQLWLPYSDIDFILCPFQQTNININIQIVIEQVYCNLRSHKNQLEISEIFFNQCHMFPTVKLQMTDKYSRQKIDLAIYHKNNNGKKYVNYIIQVLSNYPVIKPLFYFVRKVSEKWKLHDQRKGGLKSYALFLMLSFIVQSYPANNLGQHLLNIATYYGFYFEYDYFYDQNYEKDFQKFKKSMQIGSKPKNFGLQIRFSLIDPLNHLNNVGGKKTETLKVQNMFKSIYYSMHLSLLQKEGQKILPYLNQFSSLLE